MSTPLNPHVFIWDLTAVPGSSPAASTALLYTARSVLELDRPGTLEVVIAAGSSAANQLLLSRPPTGKPQVLGLSWDGVHTDQRKFIEHPVITASAQGPSLEEQGDDLAAGLGMVQVDKMTLINVLIKDAFTADPGTGIQVETDGAGDTGLLTPGTALPSTKGILHNIADNPVWLSAAMLQFSGSVNSALNNTRVSMRIWADSVLKVLESVLKQAAGLVILGSATPYSLPGSLAHVVYDTSDAPYNMAPTGITPPTVNIGYMGVAPLLTFQVNADPALQAVEAPILDGLVDDTDISQDFAQIEVQGGTSTNGLPDGAQITGALSFSTPQAGMAESVYEVQWNVGLPVVGVKVNELAGGAYFYVGDGAYRPIGNTIGINDLVFDKAGQTFTAATDYGVRTHGNNLLDKANWPKLGGLNYPVTRVFTQRVSTITYTYALVKDTQGNGVGIDGIWVNPPPPGMTEESDAAGWVRIFNHPAVLTFCLTNTFEIAVCLADLPDRITLISGLDGTQTYSPDILVPSHESVTRIVSDQAGNVYVLTAAGSFGMYWLSGTTLENMNPGATLKDVDGNAVLVNNIYINQVTTASVYVSFVLIACTSRGLFYSASIQGGAGAGGAWKPMSGQQGLQGVNVTFAAMGDHQKVLDRNCNRLVATDGSEVYYSWSSVWWQPSVRNNLDMGAAFTVVAGNAQSAPFPDFSIGAVGSGPNLAGGNLLIDEALLPANMQICRRWTEEWSLSFRVVNSASNAPYFGMVSTTSSEVGSSYQVSQVTASTLLMALGIEAMYSASLPQQVITVNTLWSDAGAGMRYLRPGMLVNLTYSGSVARREGGVIVSTHYANFTATPFFVLKIEHTMEPGGTAILAQVTLGKYLRTALPTVADLGANALYSLKNAQRWGTP